MGSEYEIAHAHSLGVAVRLMGDYTSVFIHIENLLPGKLILKSLLQLSPLPPDIAKELNNYPMQFKYDVDGSCMIVVITNAPLDSRNLERLAKRAIMGLAKTGGIASNGSGDYVIAVSTAKDNLIPYSSDSLYHDTKILKNEVISPLFLATIEATEEAILNSLFAAETMTGRDDHKILSIPIDQIIDIMKKYNKINVD